MPCPASLVSSRSVVVYGRGTSFYFIHFIGRPGRFQSQRCSRGRVTKRRWIDWILSAGAAPALGHESERNSTADRSGLKIDTYISGAGTLKRLSHKTVFRPRRRLEICRAAVYAIAWFACLRVIVPRGILISVKPEKGNASTSLGWGASADICGSNIVSRSMCCMSRDTVGR